MEAAPERGSYKYVFLYAKCSKNTCEGVHFLKVALAALLMMKSFTVFFKTARCESYLS